MLCNQEAPPSSHKDIHTHKRSLAGPLEDADTRLMEGTADAWLEALHIINGTSAFTVSFELQRNKCGLQLEVKVIFTGF